MVCIRKPLNNEIIFTNAVTHFFYFLISFVVTFFLFCVCLTLLIHFFLTLFILLPCFIYLFIFILFLLCFPLFSYICFQRNYCRHNLEDPVIGGLHRLRTQSRIKVKKSYPRNREWRPTGSRDVKDRTLSRQSAHTWR
jgi:hypothetical protein